MLGCKQKMVTFCLSLSLRARNPCLSFVIRTSSFLNIFFSFSIPIFPLGFIDLSIFTGFFPMELPLFWLKDPGLLRRAAGQARDLALRGRVGQQREHLCEGVDDMNLVLELKQKNNCPKYMEHKLIWTYFIVYSIGIIPVFFWINKIHELCFLVIMT